MAETITTTGSVGMYSNYCFNRLPCGVCRIMMCQCHVLPNTTVPTLDLNQVTCKAVNTVPTWNPTEVTCKAEEEKE